MTPSYPRSFPEIRPWADAHGVTAEEARVRFAQYAILTGIAGVTTLRDGLVFKGGNALDFVWQPNRSTADLDFSVDASSGSLVWDEIAIRRLLERGLAGVRSRLGVVFAVHRVRQNPPGEDKTFITYQARVGYALQDEVRLRQRMERGEPSPRIIELDMSLNEPICEATTVAVDEGLWLRVASIEDITAEKLRALLQQKQTLRNRERRQDLLDIAVILRQHPELDRVRIAAFLQAKAAARAVPVSRSAFRDPEIARRARHDYDELAATTRVAFVPFGEALAALLDFVEELPIPP